MAHVLITFLGRAPRHEGRYRHTSYRFPDGSDAESTAFFGWTLARRERPQRLVVLGTAGSMWDHLVEVDHDFGSTAEDERLALAEAVERKAVVREQLAPLEAPLGERLGVEVRLGLIPYARDEAEQIEVLRVMAEHVERGDTVSLDVTHGFRHLPMLALLSALHLRLVREARIGQIWYGAFDPDTGDAPVHELSGLLRIADWVGALSTFDKDGDYGVFAPLLRADGLPDAQAAHLERAAFYERTSNARDAAKTLANFERVLDAGLPQGIGTLFAAPLRDRTRWYKGRDLYGQQKRLATIYLQRGDYIRAAVFAFEAFVTHLLPEGAVAADYRAREEAQAEHENANRGDSSKPAITDYWLLKNLRNTLAHGNAPRDARVKGLVGDEARLRDELTRLIRELLP